MDLIDRAKVERITFQEPSYNDPINVLTEVRDKVRALPIVEAIPVKWIKEEISNNKGFYNSSLRRLLDEWAEREEE